MNTDSEDQRTESARIPEATEYRLLLGKVAALAEAEGISIKDLDEMDAINQMRLVAEDVSIDHYLYSSGTL